MWLFKVDGELSALHLGLLSRKSKTEFMNQIESLVLP